MALTGEMKLEVFKQVLKQYISEYRRMNLDESVSDMEWFNLGFLVKSSMNDFIDGYNELKEEK